MRPGLLAALAVLAWLIFRPRVTYAEGVEVGLATPAGAAIEAAGASAFGALGYETIVTSARDGIHMEGSAHPSGNARDFRTYHVRSLEEKRAIRDEMAATLGPRFDVLQEWGPEHIHAELDPRRGGATGSW